MKIKGGKDNGYLQVTKGGEVEMSRQQQQQQQQQLIVPHEQLWTCHRTFMKPTCKQQQQKVVTFQSLRNCHAGSFLYAPRLSSTPKLEEYWGERVCLDMKTDNWLVMKVYYFFLLFLFTCQYQILTIKNILKVESQYKIFL